MAKTDEYAELVYKDMAYQVSKEIASLGAVLYGKIDAVILTGGIAHSKKLTSLIKERVSFMAPVYTSVKIWARYPKHTKRFSTASLR